MSNDPKDKWTSDQKIKRLQKGRKEQKTDQTVLEVK